MSSKSNLMDRIINLVPLVISIITLLVFVYQTNLIRQQQFMAVYPHLKLYNVHSGSIEYQYHLVNDGVGPAFIKKIEIKDSKGQEYENMTDYLKTVISIEDSIWLINSDIYPGRLIPANKTIVLYQLMNEELTTAKGLSPNTIQGASKLRGIINSKDWSIKITYESIYGERWLIEKGNPIPTKL